VTTFDEGVEITLTTDLRTKDVAPLKEQACTDMFDILVGEPCFTELRRQYLLYGPLLCISSFFTGKLI
jgi:hypothetical protein